MTLRRLSAADALLWRDIRLEALAREPQEFSATHDDRAHRPLEDFATRLVNGSVWAVVVGDTALAVAARGSDAADPRRMWLQSVYTSPLARGRGLAGRLIVSIADEGRALGATELLLEVRGGNRAAQRLYAGQGFVVVPGHLQVRVSRCDVLMCKRL